MYGSSRLIIPFRDTETTPSRRVARPGDADGRASRCGGFSGDLILHLASVVTRSRGASECRPRVSAPEGAPENRPARQSWEAVAEEPQGSEGTTEVREKETPSCRRSAISPGPRRASRHRDRASNTPNTRVGPRLRAVVCRPRVSRIIPIQKRSRSLAYAPAEARDQGLTRSGLHVVNRSATIVSRVAPDEAGGQLPIQDETFVSRSSTSRARSLAAFT